MKYQTWSSTEKQRLNDFVKKEFKEAKYVNWNRVSKQFDNRSPQQCKSAYQQIKQRDKNNEITQQYSQDELQSIIKDLKEIVLTLDYSSSQDDTQSPDPLNRQTFMAKSPDKKGFKPLDLLNNEVNFFDNYETIDAEFAQLPRHLRLQILIYSNFFNEDYQYLHEHHFPDFDSSTLKRFHKLQQQYASTFLKISSDIQNLSITEINAKYNTDQLSFYYNDAQTTKFRVAAYKQAEKTGAASIKLVIPTFASKFPVYDGLLELPIDNIEKQFWVFCDSQYNFDVITSKLQQILNINDKQ